MKEGRALSIQRGTEETQEDQGQKPGECYHFRAGLRRWRTTKRSQDEEPERQGAKGEEHSKAGIAHSVTAC